MVWMSTHIAICYNICLHLHCTIIIVMRLISPTVSPLSTPSLSSPHPHCLPLSHYSLNFQIISIYYIDTLLRLNELLEIADDLAMDIPKLWPYMAEILSPVFYHSALSLSTLAQAPQTLVSLNTAQSCSPHLKSKPCY